MTALKDHLNMKFLSVADERTLLRKTGCKENNANFFSLLNVKRDCDVTVLFDHVGDMKKYMKKII